MKGRGRSLVLPPFFTDYSHNLLQGTAGDEYYLRLKKEYEYLSHKFGLTPMDVSQWRFLRLRPTNFPHIRIAQLAVLYHRSYGLLSRIMEASVQTQSRRLD